MRTYCFIRILFSKSKFALIRHYRMYSRSSVWTSSTVTRCNSGLHITGETALVYYNICTLTISDEKSHANCPITAIRLMKRTITE